MLTISTIVKARYFARAALRVVSVWLILHGLFNLMYVVYSLEAYMSSGPTYSLLLLAIVTTGLPIAAGLLIVNLGERLARWVFPLPERRCPFCAYPLEPAQHLCPECGISMDAPIPTTKPPAPAPATQPPAATPLQ